jgi:hypothetical protein
VKQFLVKLKTIDFEEFGFQTMVETRDQARTERICALHLHAYQDALQPELGDLRSGVSREENHALALHTQLYDRAIPVSDARMLSQSLRTRILLTLTGLACVASFAGNTVTVWLFGLGVLIAVLLAAAITALPVLVGHLAYEKIVAHHKRAQAVIIVVAASLCFVGLFLLGEARRNMAAKVDSQTATNSYIDGGADQGLQESTAPATDNSESQIRQTFGDAMLMFSISADMVLGLLFGFLAQIRSDEDYAAWLELKRAVERIAGLKRRILELLHSIEIAKKRCMAGILRAQNLWNKRRIPYHAVLPTLLLSTILISTITQAQAVERHEAILIDTSGSIARGGKNADLFREYLFATKKLLLTEPGNSRVWVSIITTDSSGSSQDILTGWTPGARGVFTDDLNRARHQLATGFEAKSSGMSAVAAGTDIFGGLWHLKTILESTSDQQNSGNLPKTIWIFSDMVNETQGFMMPALIATGPEQMLERAKANGLLVPLHGYKVHVVGASSNGLTPQAWLAIKAFWTMYFSAIGANLVSYSTECDPER